MGIPGFYRWLIDRYPNTLCSVVEQRHQPLRKPNPNGVEFDNLYIDLNGIIHSCFHPQGESAPGSYDEIFHYVYVYIDRVFSVVRPRKLLFLAVDGVAPRAKMNHQRIRRFRAAKEAADICIDKPEADRKMDSNVITPGTEFMDLLSCALRYYVYQRVNKEPGWQGIKVILSDSSVVGEGEDKIMSYIRSQRNLPGYDPNTRHCLHGMDADLIMLALATHEIHISILREAKPFGDDNRCKKLQYSLCMKVSMRDLKFEFFNIWVLREYLESELLPNVDGTDFDRLIDDFVFMCIFVGNDYLPHLPSFDISKGGIELLLKVYRHEFVKMSYLTNAPEVNLKSVEHFLQALTQDTSFMEHRKRTIKRIKGKMGSLRYLHDQLKIAELDIISRNPNADDGEVESTTNKAQIHDRIMEHVLHYTVNFDCKSHDIDRIKRHAVLKYTEGVCWVMHTYYQKVPSWQWFYPYHYAPLASDFCGLDKLEINFTLGQPFKPLDQLLGVLPAASAQALPLFYRDLMTNKSSPISDFYPEDAEVDRDGKRFDWQGVCKLPFIDESRLLSEIAKVEHTLTDEEKQRNRFGRDMLFVHSKHPLAKMIEELPSSGLELQIQIRPELSDGMNGHLCISDKPVLPFNIPSPFVDKPAVEMNSVKSVNYKWPFHAHIPKLLHGVIMPPRILRCEDRPRPPGVSPSECSAEKRKLSIAMKSDKKSRKLGDANCVDLAVAPKQGEIKDKGNQHDVTNGKPEVKLVVEASQNHLIVGKSTHPTKVQQQVKAGNGGMSGETQRVDTQVTGTEDESLIQTGICEKPSTGGDESSGDVPKRKRRKKNNNKKKLGAEGHRAEGEVPQGIKNVVSNVEEPTTIMRSSNNQQLIKAGNGGMSDEAQRVDTQVKGTEDERLINTGICEKPSTGGDESLGDVPKRKQSRKNKNKKKLEAEGREAVGEVPQGTKITVNNVEEPMLTTKSTNNLQIHPVALKHTKDDMMLVDGGAGEKKTEFLAASELATTVDVVNENPTNKMGSVGGGLGTDLVVGEMKDENINESQACVRTAKIQQEPAVAFKHTKRKRVNDDMLLTNGVAGNKIESRAAVETVTDIEVGGENEIKGNEKGSDKKRRKHKRKQGGEVAHVTTN